MIMIVKRKHKTATRELYYDSVCDSVESEQKPIRMQISLIVCSHRLQSGWFQKLLLLTMQMRMLQCTSYSVTDGV